MITAKSKLAETTSPLAAASDTPAKSWYAAVIIIVGVIILAAAGMAVYKKNAKA